MEYTNCMQRKQIVRKDKIFWVMGWWLAKSDQGAMCIAVLPPKVASVTSSLPMRMKPPRSNMIFQLLLSKSF